MNKIIILIFSIIVSGCSLNKSSKFWTSNQNIPEEKNLNYKEVLAEEKTLETELNVNISINLEKNLTNKIKNRNYFNNEGKLNYNGVLKKSSRYKFSKIKNFYKFEPTIAFNGKNLIFFDNKGSILQFDENQN